ncbi:hypothetical protein ALON55S_06870 [Alishewanella longhuensis]
MLSVGLSAVNAIAETDDEVVYSTEAYCLLSLAGAEQSYLTAYARELGMTPSRSVCNNFKQIADNIKRMELRGWSPLSWQRYSLK